MSLRRITHEPGEKIRPVVDSISKETIGKPKRKRKIKGRLPKLPYDPCKSKTDLVQEYVTARQDTSIRLKNRFKIFPSDNGRKLKLRDGDFIYSMNDIETLLNKFQEAYDQFCGSDFIPRII